MHILLLQLKLQADESEATRRRLERARNDVVRQVTAIVAEKDSLEKEVYYTLFGENTSLCFGK